MSRLRNKQLVEVWAAGEPGHSNRMSTDGKSLWSYNLLIGETKRGKKVAYDYSGKVSNTTSLHVNLAKGVADVIEPGKRGSR